MGGVRSLGTHAIKMCFVLYSLSLSVSIGRKVRKSVPQQPSATPWPRAQELTDHALKLLEL